MQVRTSALPAWAQDVLIALFVAVLQVQGTIEKTHRDPASVLRPLADLDHLGYALLIASGLVLAVRRLFPVAVFAVTAAASLAFYSLEYPDGPGWIGLFVSLYTLTAYGDGRRSVQIAGVGIVTLAVAWLIASADIEPRAAIGWVFFRIGASVMSAALGESMRSRRVLAVDAERRAELAERASEDEARARVAQERLRIAREVHDTVAHAIAVINVQAGVTAHVLDRQPERARETLVAIETTSSHALDEMRTIFGVLRDDEGRSPQPGLDRIDELFARAREAGLDIDFEERPAATAKLPSAVNAAAYRILQESITNVIRHVGPTRVSVELDYGPEALEISVVDEGGREPGTGGETGSGQGIRGMRERCELLGGRLVSGPRDAGFEVRALLPLTAGEASA